MFESFDGELMGRRLRGVNNGVFVAGIYAIDVKR